MATYQPKLNKDAMMQGFLGVDPKKLGAAAGFIVPAAKSQQKGKTK